MRVHYFVGGATKVFSLAFYHLRRGFRPDAPLRRRTAGAAERLRRDGPYYA